jgi:superfamily II DNA/RNA helicase
MRWPVAACCVQVVAFDLPRDVTSYIQCRGRARKAGSRYCFMQQQEHKANIHGLIRCALRLLLVSLCVRGRVWLSACAQGMH